MTGKTKSSYLLEGLKEYAGRLKHYVQLKEIVIPDLKNTKSMPEEEQKMKEGELILKQIPKGSYVILLDERGKAYSSKSLAAFFQKRMNEGRDICMVLGGAYGFSDAVYQQVDQLISLSRLTFSHQMVRLILLEQIYRAFTIINGEPYHHD